MINRKSCCLLPLHPPAKAALCRARLEARPHEDGVQTEVAVVCLSFLDKCIDQVELSSSADMK